jgi:hypothetical protein
MFYSAEFTSLIFPLIMQARQEHNRPASLPLPPPRHKQQTVVPSFLISLCLFFKDVTKDETSMEEYFDIGG